MEMTISPIFHSVKKTKYFYTNRTRKAVNHSVIIQLAQSWKRKQSLAIFHTGWSLFGVA